MTKRYSDLTPEQKAHRAAYYREYHKRPGRIEKRRAKSVEDQKKRRAKIATVVRAAKDRPCTDCGVTFPPEIMDFDHVRGEKLINIGHASRSRHYLTWAALAEEIAKCDVRCPNCHRMRHYRLRHGLV